MKALFLFNQPRADVLERIESGAQHDGLLYGMLRIGRYGIEADSVELEQRFSPATSRFLRRRVLNIYLAHLPFLGAMRRYDLVFTPTAFGSQFFHALFGRRRPRWIMYDFNITGFISDGRTVKQRIFRWMTSRAGGIVTIGREEAEALKRLFPRLKDKIAFIPYGVDCEFFAPRPVGRTANGASDERRVLAVGFDTGRDYGTLFKACDGLDAPVLIAGRPAKLERFGPPPKNVAVQSFAPRELVDQYANAAVVVIPLDISAHTNDAMGCSTLVEAMAMGKAIVATRTPTTESYIEDGRNGLLVAQGDAVGMRQAIERLLADPALRARLGAAARAFAVEHCEAEKVTAALADFFKKAAA